MSIRPVIIVGLPGTILYLTLPLAISTAVVLWILRKHSLASFPVGSAVSLALAMCIAIYTMIYVGRRAVSARRASGNASIGR